jgi:hypothetical protein
MINATKITKPKVYPPCIFAHGIARSGERASRNFLPNVRYSRIARSSRGMNR